MLVDKTQLTSKETLAHLTKLLKGREVRGIKQYKKFDVREIALFEDVFLHRNYSKVLFYISDFISENYFMDMEIVNAPTLKRIQFFKNLFLEGNATRAAIKSGYSPKSAKQQGYRTLQWIIRAGKGSN